MKTEIASRENAMVVKRLRYSPPVFPGTYSEGVDGGLPGYCGTAKKGVKMYAERHGNE